MCFEGVGGGYGMEEVFSGRLMRIGCDEGTRGVGEKLVWMLD
jgi:hypothetical protein